LQKNSNVILLLDYMLQKTAFNLQIQNKKNQFKNNFWYHHLINAQYLIIS